VRSRVGLDTGVDVDRVVLTSGADGAAVDVAAFAGVARTPSGAAVRVLDEGATTYDLRVKSDGEPFWLVLGQSHSEGWSAELDGESLGEPQLVNGYANGWLVDPGEAGTYAVTLKWTPQNVVWVAFALSALAILVCLVLVFVTRRRAVPDVASEPELSSPVRYDRVPSWAVSAGAAVGVGVGAMLVSRPWIGGVVGVATLVATRVPGARLLLAGGAPAALLLAKAADAPELGWLAVTLLAADLISGCVSHLDIRGRETQVEAQGPS
jgi:arabinofuranan 3-O-arabinosyltransferase